MPYQKVSNDIAFSVGINTLTKTLGIVILIIELINNIQL